jgi:hypothetical protein
MSTYIGYVQALQPRTGPRIVKDWSAPALTGSQSLLLVNTGNMKKRLIDMSSRECSDRYSGYHIAWASPTLGAYLLRYYVGRTIAATGMHPCHIRSSIIFYFLMTSQVDSHPHHETPHGVRGMSRV